MATRKTSPPTPKKPRAKKAEVPEAKIALTVPENDNKPQADEKPRPRSPVNGVELPIGKRFQPGEEQREISRRAGIKSAQTRAQRKTMRQELLDLLQVSAKDANGKEHSAQEAITVAIIRKAKDGDVRAYETIRDTLGEKFAEKVEMSVALPQFETLDAAFNKMSGRSD